jgi:hypothetical protein
MIAMQEMFLLIQIHTEKPEVRSPIAVISASSPKKAAQLLGGELKETKHQEFVGEVEFNYEELLVSPEWRRYTDEHKGDVITLVSRSHYPLRIVFWRSDKTLFTAGFYLQKLPLFD